MRRRILCPTRLCFLVLAAACAIAAAPVSPSGSDAIAIRSGPAGSRVSASQPVSMPSLGLDITRMLAALAIVIGLIFLAKWILKRFYNGSIAPAGSRAVQVLHRTVLAPKQQVMLLQVGRRVVVVGESNGNMATLAQIEDSDEIAQLIGKLHEEQSHKSAAFGGLFGRAQKKLDDVQAEPDAHEAGEPGRGENLVQGEMRSELSGLLEKVKSIREQIHRD